MNSTRRFQRRIENFTCANCGHDVQGDGYTNHCPNCLWSRHVDVNPGDRASECGGMMEPVLVTAKGGEYIILHRCTQCKFERPNRSQPNDSFDAIIAIAQTPNA